MPFTLVAVKYPPPLFAMTTRTSDAITDFVVHHSAGALTQTPLDIDAEHRALNPPDAMIAYNWVITPVGTTYLGRPPQYDSAATFGRNHESVAVCLIGNFESTDPGFTGPPTDAQLDNLLALCIAMHRRFPSIDTTYGHGQVTQFFPPDASANYATACCGDVLLAQLPDIKRKTYAALTGY